MDVTPEAIVSEVFVEVLPEILETKAADMERKIETLKVKSSQNAHSATLRKERQGVKLMHKTRWHPK